MDLTGITLLGKYEVEKQLGEGGMGAVWLGRHKLLGRQVAIKVLDDRFLNHPEVVERFGREARAASAIQHPGIVEVLDIDKTKEGVPFLVMELLEGEPLADRIERVGRMSEKNAVEVITQLLHALDAAHASGIVHRDLKPDNVFLVPRGRGGEHVKILDFGISHKSDEQGMKLTMEGSVLGTPHYMSPEQAMGKKDIDLRSDIYAAGVLFYECLTGDVPFDAENYNALILKILSEEPRTPADLGVQLDPTIEGALMSSIAKDRDLRPESCQHMLEMLRGDRPPTVVLKRKGAPSEESAALPDNDALDLDPTGNTMAAASPAVDPPPPAQRERKRSAALQGLFQNSAPASKVGPDGERLSLDLNIGKTGQADPEAQSEGLDAPLDPDLDPPGGSTPAAVATPRDSADPPPQEPRGTNWAFKALGIGAVVAGLLLAVIWVVKLSPRDDAKTTTGGAGAEVTTKKPNQPKSKMVEVALHGVPATAKVKLNGFPVAAFPLRVRRGVEQELVVQAEGFREETVTFTADENTEVTVRLRRLSKDFQKLEIAPEAMGSDDGEEDGDEDSSGEPNEDTPSELQPPELQPTEP